MEFFNTVGPTADIRFGAGWPYRVKGVAQSMPLGMQRPLQNHVPSEHRRQDLCFEMHVPWHGLVPT
jgi:hypothetical protein